MIIYLNANSKRRITASGAIAADSLFIFYQEQPNWTFQINEVSANGTVTAKDVSDGVSWQFSIDKDFSQATDPMCRTLNADIIKTGAASGTIVVPIDASRAEFLAALGTEPTLSAKFELKGFNSAGKRIYYFQQSLTCGNIIDADGETPLPIPDNLVTEAELAALLTAKISVPESSAQGDILYRGASNWERLPAGTSGQFLKTLGAAANPEWANPASSGDVIGPASSTDGNVVTFNGTTGKVIKDSGLALSGSNTGDETQSSIATKLAASGDAAISTAGAVTVTKTNGTAFGGAAILNVGTSSGTVAAGDDSRITGAAQKASNLSDLSDASTARTNLGLGTVATKTAPSGTSSQLLANDGSGGFSNVTVGANLTLSGGTLSATGGSGGLEDRDSDYEASSENSGKIWMRSDTIAPTTKAVIKHQAGSGSYSSTFSATLAAQDYCGQYTFRTAIPASAISTSGEKIKVTFKAGSGGGLIIAHASIVEQSSGATGTTIPTEILFSSASGFTISAGASITSDELTFALDESKSYLVTFDIPSGADQYFARNTSISGFTTYYKSASAAYNLAEFPSGYSTVSSTLAAVSEIQVETTGDTYSVATVLLNSASKSVQNLSTLSIAAPTIAAGAGAGTSPTVGVAGSDSSGQLTITTGSSPTAAATAATITFNSTLPNTPYVLFAPANANAAALTGATQVYATSSTTAITITAGSTALAASTQYIWNFHAF